MMIKTALKSTKRTQHTLIPSHPIIWIWYTSSAQVPITVSVMALHYVTLAARRPADWFESEAIDRSAVGTAGARRDAWMAMTQRRVPISQPVCRGERERPPRQKRKAPGVDCAARKAGRRIHLPTSSSADGNATDLSTWTWSTSPLPSRPSAESILAFTVRQAAAGYRHTPAVQRQTIFSQVSRCLRSTHPWGGVGSSLRLRDGDREAGQASRARVKETDIIIGAKRPGRRQRQQFGSCWPVASRIAGTQGRLQGSNANMPTKFWLVQTSGPTPT